MPPKTIDSWHIKDRLFRAISFRAKAHRRLFREHHLAFDGIYCVDGGVDPAHWDCLEAYKKFMTTYKEIAGAMPSDAKGILEALIKIRDLFQQGITFRGDTEFPILMPGGGRLLQGSWLPAFLYRWAEGLNASMQAQKKNKVAWEALLDLEAISPFMRMNGSIAKMMWVVIRHWLRQPPAYIPRDNIGEYQKLVSERNRTIRLRYRIFC